MSKRLGDTGWTCMLCGKPAGVGGRHHCEQERPKPTEFEVMGRSYWEFHKMKDERDKLLAECDELKAECDTLRAECNEPRAALDEMLDWLLRNRGSEWEFVVCMSDVPIHHPVLDKARAALARTGKE